MKKLLYTTIILLAASCSQSTETEAENQEGVTNPEAGQIEGNGEEQNEVSEPETPVFVGNWEYHEASIKLDVSLTINEDGTFSQQMGKSPEVSGTWEKVSDNELIMKSPTLKKEGQKWEIKEATDDKLSICWNPDSKNPKTIPFTRVK